MIIKGPQGEPLEVRDNVNELFVDARETTTKLKPLVADGELDTAAFVLDFGPQGEPILIPREGK
jgi:hypothetical protein